MVLPNGQFIDLHNLLTNYSNQLSALKWNATALAPMVIGVL